MPDLTLSFDNGPDPDATPFVLDALAERGIRTTFFVVGERLLDPRRRALAERARDEGHWIGNHTYTHSVPLGRLSEPGAGRAEIERTEELIGDLARPERWFRPFGGGGVLGSALLSPEAVAHLVAARHSCVLWNAIPRDWADPEGWVERALEQCAAQLCSGQDWTLMVLHDLPIGAMAHLPRFLDAVAARGVRLRQDFPPGLVPIHAGRIVRPLAAYVSGDTPVPI